MKSALSKRGKSALVEGLRIGYFDRCRWRFRHFRELGRQLVKDRVYRQQPSETSIGPYFRVVANKIFLTSETLAYDERDVCRKQLMAVLKNHYPRYRIRVDGLQMGYYDKCLWRYFEDVIVRGHDPGSSCWYRYAQNNKCVDRLENGESFDEVRRKTFLQRIKSEHLSTNSDIFDRVFIDDEGFIYLKSDKIFSEPSRVEKLCEAIQRYGWDDFRSRLSPIIISFSRSKQIHEVLSGRHRIATLKFMQARGMIGKQLKINCHYVEHGMESLRYTRPYSNLCQDCQWNEQFVYNENVHQDFAVEAGVVKIVGSKACAKWKLIEPVAERMFRGKTVIDVGAYRGLYCMKALECGAVRATAFEPENDRFGAIGRLKNHTADERFQAYQGDFYDDRDYERLVAKPHDTAIFLGILHHLLQLGIQKRILFSFDDLVGRIARMVQHGIVVEFAMPAEKSLELPELHEHRERFSIEEFGSALTHHFAHSDLLGRCDYQSDNSFGRYMYFATK